MKPKEMEGFKIFKMPAPTGISCFCYFFGWPCPNKTYHRKKENDPLFYVNFKPLEQDSPQISGPLEIRVPRVGPYYRNGPFLMHSIGSTS